MTVPCGEIWEFHLQVPVPLSCVKIEISFAKDPNQQMLLGRKSTDITPVKFPWPPGRCRLPLGQLCTQLHTDMPGLHSYWSAFRTKPNASHQCQTKHALHSLRCRCKFTRKLERALFPALPPLSTSLLCFPFSSRSAGKSRILDCSHVLSLTPLKTEKPQCCAAVWTYIHTTSMCHLSCQPCTAEPVSHNLTWGCRPTTWPNTRGVQQRAQRISALTLRSWLCIHRQVQLHQNKLDQLCKRNAVAV